MGWTSESKLWGCSQSKQDPTRPFASFVGGQCRPNSWSVVYWVPSTLSDNIDLLLHTNSIPALLKIHNAEGSLIVNARPPLECKIQTLSPAATFGIVWNDLRAKLQATLCRRVLNTRWQKFPCLQPGNGANIGFGPAEKQFR